MFVVVFRDEFSTIFQSFVVVVVRERVTVRNPKTDSNSEFGCPNTAEEREGCARGCSAKRPSLEWPRVDHVCHTARAPLWPRVAHAGHTWAGKMSLKILDNFAPPSILFKLLQFPPFSLQEEKSEIPSMIFSQFFSTSKHHNFLIRSRN